MIVDSCDSRREPAKTDLLTLLYVMFSGFCHYSIRRPGSGVVQEMFHVYLNKLEIAVSHFVLIRF